MTLFRPPVSWLRARRRTTAVLAAALALATLVGTAEAVVRDRIADRIAAMAAKRLGTTPDVGLGTTPALWQLARGTLPDVELTADGVAARRMTGLTVDARLRQVRRNGHGGTVGSSTVTVDADAASLAGIGADRPDGEVADRPDGVVADRPDGVVADRPDGVVADRPDGVVVPDPAHGRFVVHLGRSGALTVPVTPSLHGRTIRVTPGRPAFAGTPLPDALAEKVTARAARTVSLTGLPLRLEPRRLTVTGTGLRLTLSGGPATVTA
ncbi:DUF2993 domain-containing protein [Streptomyces sp. 5-8]|uniref:DUF2993 domain-containing protein n=1 Tax=Streptomyces musisoli TaxID=2802280 RepID=A0ABS1P390_9ACTN|nr:DUF2993 domain-containing protein [Streptomyces musisoli]MBL1106823.1 DUF2993 domain-containing protein [Streptomyces musisoli]